MASTNVKYDSRSEIKTENKTEEKDLQVFIISLYDVSKISDDEFNRWINAYSYKGFNRDKVLLDLKQKVPDIKICYQVILCCGLNGPQRAAKMQLTTGKTIESYGIPASGMKGSTGVSCQRIMSATADLCAWLLKRANPPRRIDIELPSWLQFPSAGSIKMPEKYRAKHMEFSKRFSELIGGTFNEQIYLQMTENAYLNENLHLFD